ncbi:Hypothetical predicted protein [Pelobates cultripes]|uniref:Uncharacterized protein n=1 Tax=Pelobates cultripes TaxID=61616 RepID=A0AAD1SB61_PELCU|nr:Hypothetical predicted protein [Pelobates cultripes]
MAAGPDRRERPLLGALGAHSGLLREKSCEQPTYPETRPGVLQSTPRTLSGDQLTGKADRKVFMLQADTIL